MSKELAAKDLACAFPSNLIDGEFIVLSSATNHCLSPIIGTPLRIKLFAVIEPSFFIFMFCPKLKSPSTLRLPGVYTPFVNCFELFTF